MVIDHIVVVQSGSSGEILLVVVVSSVLWLITKMSISWSILLVTVALAILIALVVYDECSLFVSLPW